MNVNADSIRNIDKIPERQWAFYDDVLATARETGRPFAIGGAMAWATYSGYYRNTKDIDLYIPERDKQIFIDAVTKIGTKDYFETLQYDRGWIYRSTRDDCIADLIWAMANYVRPLDDDYFKAETTLLLHGNRYPVLPAEELIMNKLYIMQRKRCDWFDVFNLLYYMEGKLDWDRLIAKMGENAILLGSVLRVFAWLCPGRVKTFPESLWRKLNLPIPPGDGPEIVEQRVRYLDSRPWFLPALKPGEEPFFEG
jgi:hypothetical protein